MIRDCVDKKCPLASGSPCWEVCSDYGGKCPDGAYLNGNCRLDEMYPIFPGVKKDGQ